MNAKSWLISLMLIGAATPCSSQGFAGLGQQLDGYAFPNPETRFEYPKDHGAHPAFRIEWWYLTANLKGPDGTDFGVQWTLFRNALEPSEKNDAQAWLGHAAISSPQGHFSTERLARGGLEHAGVTAQPFHAFIDEWELRGESLSNISAKAQGVDFAFSLQLAADRDFVPQGVQGFSVKSDDGRASHYYSQPFYRVSGTLDLPNGPVEVVGNGWLDREWSSSPLAENQTGWDWMSLHLSSGEKLMAFRLRQTEGPAFTVGTWISDDGAPKHLEKGEVELTPLVTSRVEGRDIPTEWRVYVPSKDIDLEIAAIYPDSWMSTTIPYWEGPVRIEGSETGVGYLEMTGYE